MAQNKTAQPRAIKTAQNIIGAHLQRAAQRILKDNTNHNLCTLLSDKIQKYLPYHQTMEQLLYSSYEIPKLILSTPLEKLLSFSFMSYYMLIHYVITVLKYREYKLICQNK